MSKGLEYRSLIHDFFDGRLTAVELKERASALRLKQMELFTLTPTLSLKGRGRKESMHRAPDTGYPRGLVDNPHDYATQHRNKEHPHSFRRP